MLNETLMLNLKYHFRELTETPVHDKYPLYALNNAKWFKTIIINSVSSTSACRVAPETGVAASAPVSAAGRASAACSAPRKRLTAWRRTTCSPPARQEGDPVDLREDAALLQDSAVMQVRKS